MNGAVPAVTVEKRDADGRLLAIVRVAGGVLDGTCRFYAEDGETVIAEATMTAGRPAVPPASAAAFAEPSDSPF